MNISETMVGLFSRTGNLNRRIPDNCRVKINLWEKDSISSQVFRRAHADRNKKLRSVIVDITMILRNRVREEKNMSYNVQGREHVIGEKNTK